MEIKELARKRYFMQVTVFGKCDIATCQHHARCVVIIDGTLWQLCKFCYRKLMKERNALQSSEAAEHSVQRTCARCGADSWRDAISPDTLEICTVCGASR